MVFRWHYYLIAYKKLHRCADIMYTIIKRIQFFNKYIFLLSLLISNSIILSPVYSQYQIRITNGQIISSKIFEFDIFIKSLSNEFTLSSYQGALSCSEFAINKGELSFSYVSNSSALTNYPANSIGVRLEQGLSKLCFASNASNNTIGNDFIRVGKFRIKNTRSFIYDSLNIIWVFNGNIRTLITDDNYLDVTLPENFSNLNDPLPTPVESITLSAEISNNQPQLNWISITELNVNGYEVERKSLNPAMETEWETVGFVSASTTSSSVSKYSFTDKTRNMSGNYKYRLKILDLDGKYSYSNEIEVNIKIANGFLLYQNYPNPFNPTTTIKYSLPFASQIKLTIYNSIGQEIISIADEIQNEGVHEKTFNANGLTSGNYFYVINVKSIIDGMEFRDVRKMIVLK